MVARDLPQTFGRYELLAQLGSGGMATVYLARARGLGGFEREVALKITHGHLSDDADFLEGLLQEARIAARIRHPNVVPVLDVGQDREGAFLVMDYVEGEVLSAIVRHERLAGGRVPAGLATRILADALAGLHAAHELRDDEGALLGIVHRDFSPQNILVGLDGSSRLTDFGIARVASTSSTKSGMIKGKLGYLSPEQVRSPRSVDRRTDVWAAGVVAWELATGKPLRPRDDEAATLLRIVSEEPPRARTTEPAVPEAMDEAIAHALRMAPDERIASADTLRRRLLDAAAASGVKVADASEVADYVARVAGEKLRERRRSTSGAIARAAVARAAPVEEEPVTEAKTRGEARVDSQGGRGAKRARTMETSPRSRSSPWAERRCSCRHLQAAGRPPRPRATPRRPRHRPRHRPRRRPRRGHPNRPQRPSPPRLQSP